jgi:hypothetical protein
MLRHLGTKRTYRHNVKLASLLGLIAGFVNAAGFLGRDKERYAGSHFVCIGWQDQSHGKSNQTGRY